MEAVGTHTVRNKLCIFAMSTVIVASVEYPDSVVVLLGEIAKELAEAGLIVLSHLWSGRHNFARCHRGQSRQRQRTMEG